MKAPIASPIQISAALHAVSQEYRVSEELIMGHRKLTELSEARMWFWLLLRVATEANCNSLARLSGHVSTSIHHSTCKAIDWMRIYPALRQRYDRIVTAFSQRMDKQNEL